MTPTVATVAIVAIVAMLVTQRAGVRRERDVML